MTQPLSGESSVLGICLISEGFFLFQQRESCVSSKESLFGRRLICSRRLRTRVTDPGYRGGLDHEHQQYEYRGLNAGFAVGGAEADGFLRKIVAGPDETDSAAFCPHQNRMGDGGRALGADPAQDRAIAAAGGAADDAVSVGQITGVINALALFCVHLPAHLSPHSPL